MEQDGGEGVEFHETECTKDVALLGPVCLGLGCAVVPPTPVNVAQSILFIEDSLVLCVALVCLTVQSIQNTQDVGLLLAKVFILKGRVSRRSRLHCYYVKHS